MGMNFGEALAEMKRGKQIKRAVWDKRNLNSTPYHWAFRDGQIFDAAGLPVGVINPSAVLADDWKAEWPGHGFPWAVAQMTFGGHVKRRAWSHDANVFSYSNGTPIVFAHSKGGKSNWIPQLNDLNAQDWIQG